MSPDAQAILDALISARLAWQSPCELASAADLGHDPANDALVELDLAGWIVPWETDDGLDVTLASLAASVLGVHLVEHGPEELPRWAREGSPDPPPLKAKNCMARYSTLALVCDPYPPPDELVALLELAGGLGGQSSAEAPEARFLTPEEQERLRLRKARARERENRISAEKARERRKLKRSKIARKRRRMA